jgi:two-component system, chemotaxis family, response regulator PixG
MTVDFSPDITPIENFDASKQTKLFQALKHNRFSGQLSFKNAQNIEWSFFLYLGRIIYGTGGKHPTRRWRRNLVIYLPQIAKELSQQLKAISLEQTAEIYLTWDYHLLHLWVQQQKINLEQVTQYIRGLTSEILFDVTQANSVSFHLTTEKTQSFQPLAMIDAQQQIVLMQKFWQKWQGIGFQDISPDLVPNIVNSFAIKEISSEKTYQGLTRLIDGKHTIRDLAVQKQVDYLTFLRSIMSYIQLGDIQLSEILDIPCPIAIPEATVKNQLTIEHIGSEYISELTNNPQKLLIACVTNSSIMYQVMTKVVLALGCEFVGENHSLNAMPLLLDSKPNLIFLDIELPNFSGYEICSQLRQLEYFSQTPIILLGRNIGLIERMKSKMSGASELFQKSMDVKAFLHLVQKYSTEISNITVERT